MGRIKVLIEINNANEGTINAIEMGSFQEAIELCFSGGEGMEEVTFVDVIEGYTEAKKTKV